VSDLAGTSLRPTSRMASDALDWQTMAERSIRLSLRTPDALLTSLLLPILLMLMFVYLFGGAIETGTDYVTYVVPGVLLLCAGFGAATTAVSVSQDLAGGIIDRFRSLDVGGTAVLAGHVAASVVRNIFATILVFVVAFLIGFRPVAGLLDWLGAAGILLAYILAISWLSAAVGCLTRSPEAAGAFTFIMAFVPYPSSAFVPVETMPEWIQGFAENQPITPIIETLRGLLLDLPVGEYVGPALAWCGGILIVSIAVAEVLFRRRTA
jgi:ABC-2 type transport system permease protein